MDAPEYLSEVDKALWAEPSTSLYKCVCTRCGNDFTYEAASGVHPSSRRKVCDKCSPQPQPRVCRYCQKEYQKRPNDGSLSKYCCEAHRQAYVEQQRSVARAVRTCGRCGTVLDGKGKQCPACRADTVKTCDRCGDEFTSPASHVKACHECRITKEKERKQRARNLHSTSKRSGSLHQSQRTGSGGEFLFDALCARNGWLAARPIMETNPGWDRIVIRDGIADRVQIKSVSTLRSNSCTHLNRSERPLDKELCDIVAVVDVDTADVWLIPIEVVPNTFHPSDWTEVLTNSLGLTGA